MSDTEAGRPDTPARRSEILTVYLIGLFQGLSLVAFPAASAVLTDPSGYDLSSSEYGLLFVPQVCLAIAGSLAFPSLSRRHGTKPVLLAGVLADVLAMVLLVASNAVGTGSGAYPLLLLATGALGLGFGLTLSSLNTYAGEFFPERREVALTGLNVLLGLGTALSPLLVALFTDIGEWWWLPLLASAGLTILFVAALAEPLKSDLDGPGGRRGPIPGAFWLFALALVAYGICETMFGNWGTTLLRDGGVAPNTANYALAAFWASVTIGRLLIALAPRSWPSTTTYLALPWGIAAALLLVSFATSAGGGVVLFSIGGLACSGFFPMTIGYGETTFPRFVALAAGWLVAAYQVGYGIAAFGGGVLQSTLSLAELFRVAAVFGVAMALMAIAVARLQSHPRAREPSGASG